MPLVSAKAVVSSPVSGGNDGQVYSLVTRFGASRITRQQLVIIALHRNALFAVTSTDL